MNLLEKPREWFRRITEPPPGLAPKDILSYVPAIPEEPKVIRTYYLMGVSHAYSEWMHIPQNTLREFVDMFNAPDERLPYQPHVRFCAKSSRGAAYTYTAALFKEQQVGTFRIARGDIRPKAGSKASIEGHAIRFTGVDLELTAGKYRGLLLPAISVMVTPIGELISTEP